MARERRTGTGREARPGGRRRSRRRRPGIRVMITVKAQMAVRTLSLLLRTEQRKYRTELIQIVLYIFCKYLITVPYNFIMKLSQLLKLSDLMRIG